MTPEEQQESAEQRKSAVLAASGVAVHGLLAGGYYDQLPVREIIKFGFDIGTEFVAEAERRFGKLF